MTTFQTPRAGERMIAVEEAQQRVLAEVSLIGTETVAFTEALGRVLREEVRANVDVPQLSKPWGCQSKALAPRPPDRSRRFSGNRLMKSRATRSKNARAAS